MQLGSILIRGGYSGLCFHFLPSVFMRASAAVPCCEGLYLFREHGFVERGDLHSWRFTAALPGRTDPKIQCLPILVDQHTAEVGCSTRGKHKIFSFTQHGMAYRVLSLDGNPVPESRSAKKALSWDYRQTNKVRYKEFPNEIMELIQIWTILGFRKYFGAMVVAGGGGSPYKTCH